MLPSLSVRAFEKARRSADMGASEENLGDEWGLVAVRDVGEGRDGLRDDEIGEFADGHRAKFLGDTHRIGGVEGAGVEGLGRGKAHSDAA